MYGLLKRKRSAGTAFPSVDLREDGDEDLEPGAAAAFDGWKEEYRLEAGPSRIVALVLPEPPVPSPPETTIDFPDEPPVVAHLVHVPEVPEASEASESPAPSAATPAAAAVVAEKAVLRTSSRTSSRHATPVGSPRATRSSRPSSPVRAKPPPATVALQDVLPRRSPSALAADLDVPPWEPVDNYAPAATPVPPAALKVLMPLESDFASRVPPLPPIPLGAQGSGHRHRRGSKGDTGKVDTFKLHLTYGLNPLSAGIARSAKCVLTADWRVAQAELRHIRAMERIEAKKTSGRWSLRQPKKHRGPPVPKSHWDWLLEEMVSSRPRVCLTRAGVDSDRLYRGEAVEARCCSRAGVPDRRVACVPG